VALCGCAGFGDVTPDPRLGGDVVGLPAIWRTASGRSPATAETAGPPGAPPRAVGICISRFLACSFLDGPGRFLWLMSCRFLLVPGLPAGLRGGRCGWRRVPEGRGRTLAVVSSPRDADGRGGLGVAPWRCGRVCGRAVRWHLWWCGWAWPCRRGAKADRNQRVELGAQPLRVGADQFREPRVRLARGQLAHVDHTPGNPRWRCQANDRYSISIAQSAESCQEVPQGRRRSAGVWRGRQ
jgi:hypothetical protein